MAGRSTEHNVFLTNSAGWLHGSLQRLLLLFFVFVPASMAAVVVVVMVCPVLAPDLARTHRGLGQVRSLQIEVFESGVLVMLCQRGRRAPYGTEINNWLRKERKNDQVREEKRCVSMWMRRCYPNLLYWIM